MKHYYFSQNHVIMEKLDLDQYNYDISYYSPYIEILFDDLNEYENNENELMEILNSSNDVESILIDYISFDESTINGDSERNEYLLVDAFDDIGVNETLFTGDGVRVGTIESGTPNATANLKLDRFTRLSSLTTSHSTIVTSIIGGTSGIAEDVHFYCIGLSNHSFTSCVNTLIEDYNVNIINMSAHQGAPGFYDNYCAYIDNIIATTNCTFIKAAGNNGASDSPVISTPGCGMNVITVGSIDSDKDVSSFSSWDTSNTYLYKPDLVAPGGGLSTIPNISTPTGFHNGTSYSTPMVTGIVALLMEEFPILRSNPSLVKAALQNGCEKLPSQENYFDEQCGFGLVNYINSRNYLINSQYDNFNIPANSLDGDIVVSYNITIPASKGIKINATWLINSMDANVNNNGYIPEYTKCRMRLYDVQKSAYVKDGLTNSNLAFLCYVNGSTASKQYRIELEVIGTKAQGGAEVGSLVYNIFKHNHDYEWVAVDDTYHQKKCECGETASQKIRHTIDGSYVDPIGNGRYKPCAFCGYSIDTWAGGLFPVLKNNTIVYVTFENGNATFYSSIEEYCVLNQIAIVNNINELNALLQYEEEK